MNEKILIGILCILTSLTGFLYYKNIVKPSEYKEINFKKLEVEVDLQKSERESINLYIPDYESKILEKEEIKIVSSTELNEKVKFLIDNLIESNSLISQEVRLINLYISGNNLYLNFSKNLGNNIKNSTDELLLIYSIVNTVTELQVIEEVKILLDNKEEKTLGGYINISNFFKKDKLLLKGD